MIPGYQRGRRLELLVASLMRDTTDLDRRLSDAGISRDALAAVKAWARANSLLTGRYIPLARFQECFEEPLLQDKERMVYQLNLWPEHLFDAGVTADGGVFFEGFRLKHTDAEDRLKLNPRDSLSRLTIGRHTWREVELMLGKPTGTHGWGPMEDWFYGSRDDASFLTLGLDFGLLATVSWGPYTSM